MLIAVIPVRDYDTAKQQIQKALEQADGVELRLDYLFQLDIDAIARLRAQCTLPVIFTLRSALQGGHYPCDEALRLQDMLRLAALNPDYVDVEYDVPDSFLQVLCAQYPSIKIICSYHDFIQTPEDLPGLFNALQRPYFYAYKIATQANTTTDALRMLVMVSKLQSHHKISGLCMGEYGLCTRIVGPVVGSMMSYACLDHAQATAPGQFLIRDLLTIYHYRQLNLDTKLYALIGDPVSASVGHIVHNQAMRMLHQNAVYLTLRVTSAALPEIIALCRNLPIWGFSITMPLKERMVSWMDSIEPRSKPIQAINTMVKHQQSWMGCNTDGLGAIEALKQKCCINQQTIAILGAGGSARAIAYEALRQKARVIILNRSESKAQQLAMDLGCEAGALVALPSLQYTVLINTLPEQAYTDPSLAFFVQSMVVPATVIAMDIVYQPIDTVFINIVKALGCRCVFGYEMYIFQALLQIQYWFAPSSALLSDLKTKMQAFFLEQVVCQ